MYVCMYVCLSVCLYVVCLSISCFPIARQWTDFQNSNGINSGFWNLLPVWPGKSKMTFVNRFLAHNLIIYGRIFKIQTAYVQVWSKWWWKNVVTKNRLPVLTGKGFLLISWELIDGFSKFKRHTNIFAENQLPIWTRNGYLLIT